MKGHPIEHIRQFARLTPEDERRIKSIMVERTFRKGETIRGAINFSSYTYYIESGCTRIFYTLKGKERTVDFSFDGEFMLIPRIVLEKCSDTVAIEFLEPTRVLFIPILQVKDILEGLGVVNDHDALLFLNATLMHYTRNMEERLHVMQNFDSREKLAWVTERYPRLLECATITQVASFLGLTKETLYRIRSGTY